MVIGILFLFLKSLDQVQAFFVKAIQVCARMFRPAIASTLLWVFLHPSFRHHLRVITHLDFCYAFLPK
jgi:hypothetical protein